MKDRNFLLQDTEYERLDGISATMLVNSDFLISPADESKDIHVKASETEVIFALGFMATVVMSSFFLLYRCLEATPANLNTNSKSSTAYIEDITNRGWSKSNELQYGFQASQRLN